MSTQAREVVMEMLTRWKAMDLDGALALFGADAVFVDEVRATPARGLQAIRAVWDAYLAKIKTYDLEIRCVFGDDRMACVERIDIFGLLNGSSMRLPITGVFEVGRDGLISPGATIGTPRWSARTINALARRAFVMRHRTTH